jgi:hypothetical protein
MSHDTSSHTHLSLEFGAVLKRTVTRFEKIFLPMLALFAISILAIAASALSIAAITWGLYTILPTNAIVMATLVTFVAIAILFVLYAVLSVTIMNVHLLEKQTFDFLPLFKKSYKQIFPVFTILLITGLGELGGYVLGILPGIWLAIVLSFVTFIAVFENKGVNHAISKSAHLVKNDFWNVFAFALFALLGSLVLSVIPWIGALLQIVFGIFTYALSYELYTTLEHNKGAGRDETHYNKNIVLVTKLFAVCALLALIILTLIFSAFLAGVITQTI